MKKSLLRGSMVCAAAAMLAAAGSPLEAQTRDKELRLDFITARTGGSSTTIGVGYPGTFALGIYMNNNFALEPQLGALFTSNSDTDTDGGEITAGVFAPWYFNGDMGRTGLFLSPGVILTKGLGDDDTDVRSDYGLDFGVKLGRSERVSTRLALTMRDGDSFGDPEFGGVFGIGMFWR